jgi:hypothetical protein
MDTGPSEILSKYLAKFFLRFSRENFDRLDIFFLESLKFRIFVSKIRRNTLEKRACIVCVKNRRNS